MIGKIGYKRSVVIVVLVGLAALSFSVTEWMFKPKVEENRQKLNAAKSEIGTLQGELDKMRADFELFEGQKEFFARISRVGFFNDQDRVLARQRFDTMQKMSKIISAKYEIKAADILNDEIPADVGYVVMASPISIELSAIDDLDIYRFIYYLNYAFPGHITIKNLVITRSGEVTPDTLRTIGVGSAMSLVTAKMELEWRTMASRDAIKATDVPGQTESAP